MRTAGLAPLFVAILAVGTVVAVTMIAMLVWFLTGQGTAGAWGSLVVALTAAGAALGVTLLAHLALSAAGRGATRRREREIGVWTQVWSEVSAGAEVPAVPKERAHQAAEAAARVLQHLVGEGAERVRQGLVDSGVLVAEIAAAARQVGAPRSRATAALERLAWIAMPDSLPLFRVAARSADERAARAAVLGATRTLGAQSHPEPVGSEVVATIEGYVAAAAVPAGTRSFLAAALVAAGDHLPWLCSRLLSLTEHEAVHIATLDAIGISRRPEAVELAAEALLHAVEDETEAAALRTLARIGHVPERAVASVVEAASEAHEGTRVQAAYALVWTDESTALPVLWTLLGDRSWEVRQAAAFALQQCGPRGEETLRRAAASHPDRFARDVAAVVGGRPVGPGPTPERATSVGRAWTPALEPVG